MSRAEKIIEGLKILSNYADFDIAAEHDIIYAGPTFVDCISEEDKNRLEELGWHVDSETSSYARFV